MKRPESLYRDQGTGALIKVRHLENMTNPALNGESALGVELGVVKGETLLCEEALFFFQPLSYSVVAKTDLLVYRFDGKEACS